MLADRPEAETTRLIGKLGSLMNTRPVVYSNAKQSPSVSPSGGWTQMLCGNFTNLASFLTVDLSALSFVVPDEGPLLLLSDEDAESALVATPVPDVELTSADPELVLLALRSAGCVDDLTSPDESPSGSML